MTGVELLDFALKKFEKEEYEAALEAFILAYGKGYERKWILENIFNCYVAGNETEFQQAYERQPGTGDISYRDCTLDFIPYRDGEYFIFDKVEGEFVGLLSMPELLAAESDSFYKKMEFSALALVLDWDIRKFPDLFTAGQRKIYMVCRDRKRYMSFWKIPELGEYLKNITVFPDYGEFQAYFHEHTSVYLPMVLCGSEEERKRLEEIRKEEHQYRLTPQGRNAEKVLLTIAIPTARRGNLLLKRLENLLSMPYDAEIEIAVSKNGNDIYEEEYRQVGRMRDARLCYCDHSRELRFYQSLHYAVEMSHGKYVMLVSDEDDVVIDALEHYLKLLDKNPELSLVRARTTFEYLGITRKEYGEKGLEAFKVMFLRQAYISGLIVRRNDFIEADFLNTLKEFTDNVFFQHYPHEWWCALLCRRGAALLEPEILILEGEPVETGEALPSYGTYESRLEQFQGQIDFLKFMMGDDKEGLEAGLSLAMKNNSHLFRLARAIGYDSENYPCMVALLMSAGIKAIEEFSLRGERKARVLYSVKNCCMEALNLDIFLRAKTKKQEEMFRQVYRRQAESAISYEDCILDFIPCGEGEYYIFDKDKCVFWDRLSVAELERAQPDNVLKSVEFSAAAVVLDWDIRKAFGVLTTAKERKIYVICKDPQRCLSFWKVPELSGYLKYVKVFFNYEEYQQFFHENISVYMPRVFFGSEEERSWLEGIREEEHRYRLTMQGRDNSNVLLTIAIPTANRGNLVLKRLENLRKMPYDAEIEIVVCKNDSRLYEQEYEKVSKIPDARICYFNRKEEIKWTHNWHHAVELSCGKYVMLTSDEDDVLIEGMEHYLKFLASHTEISMVRPKSVQMYHHVTKRIYGKKGRKAFETVFLTQNHFPGMIVKREDFVNANLLKLESYIDNIYYRYYPHEWWCIMLSQMGDCVMEPVLLYDDSQPINVQEERHLLGYRADFVPGWLTYETRIGYFQGAVDLLQSIMKIDDRQAYEKYLCMVIDKTYTLMGITRNMGYDVDNYAVMVDKFASAAISAIGESFLDKDQKIRILYRLETDCKELFLLDEELKMAEQQMKEQENEHMHDNGNQDQP